MARCLDCIHFDVCDTDRRERERRYEQCGDFLHKDDLVPKFVADNLEYTLIGVMHSVDKWLEGDELYQDEVNRAITMREKTLRLIEEAELLAEKLGRDVDVKLKYILELEAKLENAKTEVAREIFGKINEIKKKYASGDIDGHELYVHLYLLEKKYTEEK